MRSYTLLWFLFFVSTYCYSQIGAEAQGGKMTTWIALGLDQELSTRVTSVTDFGFGRHGDPNNFALLSKQGLIVFTQDFIYRFNSHWRLAASFGYWRRNFYSEDPPYEATPGLEYRNELRPFQRVYYDQKIGRLSLTHTARFDYRFYWTPAFAERWPTPFEFRARYMLNLKIPISPDQLNQIILVDEILAATDKRSAAETAVTGEKWSPFKLTENRFSVYYRRKLKHLNADLDLGLMHQYWREVRQTDFTTSLNVMVDLIIYNPFGKKRTE
jgi:hypothetical protein